MVMKCSNCGRGVDNEWEFCPGCGAPIGEERFTRGADIFSGFEKELEKTELAMNQAFKNFEMFDLKPLLKPQKASGFSIVISEATGKEPQISIKTFGDVKREDVEKHLKRELAVPVGFVAPATPSKAPAKERPRPQKAMEEPETVVEKTNGSVVVTMKLPDVKSEKDIEINQLEESIEVRAFGKGKGYFKILSIPQGFSMVGKEFSEGTLRLEIA